MASEGVAAPDSGAAGGAAGPYRFVALGDSLTEGLGDPVRGGGWRGWAALLADALGETPGSVALVNLARSRALAADIAERQLPAARELTPRYVSLVVGANDTLRDAFAIERVAAALDLAHGALSADGAVVLTACLPDPGRMLGLPAPLARPLARRMRAVNTVVHAVSARYGACICTWPTTLGHRPRLVERGPAASQRAWPPAAGPRLPRGARRHRPARRAAARLTLDGRPRAAPGPPCGWRPGARAGSPPGARICCPACSPWPSRSAGTVWRAPGGCWTPPPTRPPAARSPHSARTACRRTPPPRRPPTVCPKTSPPRRALRQ
ncbi:SGNH/GDSL hydrolase family protein [Streptomyces lydicus]|nr:SGNH/GDSL hydrolase family protein [Streptomyces lydicus]